MATVPAVIDFHPSNRQPKQLLTTVCMSPLKKRKSLLSLGRGRSGYEIRRAVRLVVSYSGSCNVEDLQRRTHVLVSIRKEFTNKQGHSLCGSQFRKIVASLHLRQISKKDEEGRKQSIMLGSSPFIKTSPTCKTKKPS